MESEDGFDRPELRAYLAALNAWLAAGGPAAPPFVTALKYVALTDLQAAVRSERHDSGP